MIKSLSFIIIGILLAPSVFAGGNNGLTFGQCNVDEANYFYDTPDGPRSPGYGNYGHLYAWNSEEWVLVGSEYGFNTDTRINTTLTGDENSITYTSSSPLNAVFTYESLGLATEVVNWNTGYGHDTITAQNGSLFAVLLCNAYVEPGFDSNPVPSGGEHPPTEPVTEVPEFSDMVTIGAIGLLGVGLIFKRRNNEN